MNTMALNSNSFKDIEINLVAISSYHHIKMNFKGVGKSSPLSGNSDYGGVIRDGYGAVMWN